jgi:prolyl-tRNA editing enzyme YbaK/EbsC (Cys-tRNA(Pro) deacylase)
LFDVVTIMYMQLGKLHFIDLQKKSDLAPDVVYDSVTNNKLTDVLVTEIDTTLADTAAFCEAYDIGMEVSANCVIVEAKRADKTWYAACVILATNRADINGIVRKHLDARKISFAPMDAAVSMTGMEYGGITPIGLPSDWPIIIDSRVNDTYKIIVGGGVRRSKLLIPGRLLSLLPNSIVLDIVKTETI